jgi:hypothetical protein
VLMFSINRPVPAIPAASRKTFPGDSRGEKLNAPCNSFSHGIVIRQMATGGLSNPFDGGFETVQFFLQRSRSVDASNPIVSARDVGDQHQTAERHCP